MSSFISRAFCSKFSFISFSRKMAPQKKPPKNAFSFYMDEYIPELKKRGVKINHKRKF